MKANAPEKLYITNDEKRFSDKCHSASTEKYVDNDIEYIRADAFMKKAENFLEMLGYGFTITDNITHANYDKKQLIEDFRKYIEGE